MESSATGPQPALTAAAFAARRRSRSTASRTRQRSPPVCIKRAPCSLRVESTAGATTNRGELRIRVASGPDCDGICSATPVAVNDITTATQVSVGDTDACALLATGRIDCWGSNDWGSLGDALEYEVTFHSRSSEASRLDPAPLAGRLDRITEGRGWH